MKFSIRLKLGIFHKLFTILIIVILPTFATAQTSNQVSPDVAEIQAQRSLDHKFMQEIFDSHIEGNVPLPDDFESYLVRDLLKYFKDKLSLNVSRVEFQLLREGPTQTGIAYPKFYLWAYAYKNTELVEMGAFRIAAIGKKYFDIYQFIPLTLVKSKPEILYKVFPEDLIPKILSLAEEN